MVGNAPYVRWRHGGAFRYSRIWKGTSADDVVGVRGLYAGVQEVEEHVLIEGSRSNCDWVFAGNEYFGIPVHGINFRNRYYSGVFGSDWWKDRNGKSEQEGSRYYCDYFYSSHNSNQPLLYIIPVIASGIDFDSDYSGLNRAGAYSIDMETVAGTTRSRYLRGSRYYCDYYAFMGLADSTDHSYAFMGGSYLDDVPGNTHIAPLRNAGVLGRGLYFVLGDTFWKSLSWYGHIAALGSRYL